MRWKPWLLLFTLAVAASGVLAFYAAVALKSEPKASDATTSRSGVFVVRQDQPQVTFLDAVRGNPKGSVLIVEYGDYICPFCRGIENDVQRLLAAHPDTVKFVWKDLPNPHYHGSDLMAEAAQCAKQQNPQKFWEYRDRLFQEQSAVNDAQLGLIAGDLSLDTQTFTKCLTNHDMKPLIDRSVSEAVALGIDATPYFFINGKRYSGQLSYDQLEAAVAAKK